MQRASTSSDSSSNLDAGNKYSLHGEQFMIKISIALFASLFILTGCVDDDAKIVNENLTKAGDMFELDRRIVFYNGITDQYILTIDGKCSIDTSASGKTFKVTCKVGPGEYKKHFLGLSDNVTFFAEQLEPAKANAYHYRVIFKPQVIIPDIDLAGSTKALTDIVK